MTTQDYFRSYNNNLLSKILTKKEVVKPQVFKVDAKDPNFDKPLSSLNQDFSNTGAVVFVTRIKPVYND